MVPGNPYWICGILVLIVIVFVVVGCILHFVQRRKKQSKLNKGMWNYCSLIQSFLLIVTSDYPQGTNNKYVNYMQKVIIIIGIVLVMKVKYNHVVLLMLAIHVQAKKYVIYVYSSIYYLST